MLKQAITFSLLLLFTSCAPPLQDPEPLQTRQQDWNNPKQQALPAKIPQAVDMKVGLLLPLSGESATLGHALLDAANLALYDSYLSLPAEKLTARVILVPQDSGNTPEEAAKAANQLVAQGAVLILGPLFSSQVAPVKAIASAKNISVISFSNNRAVASADSLVFGFMPEPQVERVVEYAVQHDINRIALLAPNDAYGEKVKAVAQNAASRTGGNIVTAELYSGSAGNMEAAVTRLAENYQKTEPEKRFNGLLIAEGGYKLKALFDSMKKHNLDLQGIKLLGTGQWDEAELSRQQELRGAWFASGDAQAAKRFEQRYLATYKAKPPRIASLSYDAVAWVVQLALQSGGSVPKEKLFSQQGFYAPAGGLVRFTPAYVAERKLSVLEITPSGFNTLEAAGKQF